jgi:hypothetical protein
MSIGSIGNPDLPAHVTIKTACRIIGGDEPIDPSTFYRGVKAGIYPAPFHPAPGISRVDTADLLASLDERRAASKAAMRDGRAA